MSSLTKRQIHVIAKAMNHKHAAHVYIESVERPPLAVRAEINNAYGELILIGIVEVNGANSIHEQPEKVVSIHPDKLKRMGLL